MSAENSCSGAEKSWARGYSKTAESAERAYAELANLEEEYQQRALDTYLETVRIQNPTLVLHIANPGTTASRAFWSQVRQAGA